MGSIACAGASRRSWGTHAATLFLMIIPLHQGMEGIRLPLLNERDNGEKQLEKDILG